MHNYIEQKETERLYIRPLTLDDLGDWEKFFHTPSSLLFFPPFLTGKPKKDATSWIEKQLDRYKDGRFGLQALIEKSTGKFVGQCGLLTQEIDNAKVIEIGYSLLPEHEGKGYATEAAKHFKKYAFDNKLTNSLVSIIHVDNIASQQVATRNGMTNSKRTTFHEIDVFVFRLDR